MTDLWIKAELEQWRAAIGGIIFTPRKIADFSDKDVKKNKVAALPESAGGVSIDSRTLQKGDIFFAIKGDRFDGHDYAAAAAKRGASLIIIDKAHESLAAQISVPCLIVNDVMDALRALGIQARARLRPSAKVTAITGSVGKTTVKEMLAQVLSVFGKTHKNPASFNNHWGVPLTLARMPRDTDYAVFEIGMSHAGEITPLVKMARPHLALITRIAAAHMGHFNSLAEIAAAKAEIFSGAVSGGYAVLNEADEFFTFLAKEAAARGLHIAPFQMRDALALQLKAQGQHMRENAAAVLAAIRAFAQMSGKDAAPEEAKAQAALAEFSAPAGRGARYHLALPTGGAFTLIDESYNANPLSMRAALAVLAQTPAKRRITVLGDMLELGQNAQAEHEALAEPLAKAGVKRVFLIGALMGALAAKLQSGGGKISRHQTAAEVLPLLQAELQDGDCLMIKSSNSVGTGEIAAALRAHYPIAPA